MQFPRNFNIGPPFYHPSSTKKNNTFLSTPLQDCSLCDVPGVGEVSHARLLEAGISTPEQLVGHFLVCKRDHDAMTRWLVALGIRTQEAVKIATALERKGRAVVAV